MSGREKFAKYVFLINLITKFFKYSPEFLVDISWSFSQLSNNNICNVIRYAILKNRCKYLGDNVFISKNVELLNIGSLSIGHNVSIHKSTYIDAIGSIEIGDNVSIAHSSSLVSFEHGYDDESIPIKYNIIKLDPIFISNDVWIGCGVRVLAGSQISARTIIAAGAVVKGSCSRGIWAGIPAKKVREF